MTYLVDSNIFIYATKHEDPVAYHWLLNNDNFFFSSITSIEVLGYNKLNSEIKSDLKQIFSVGTELGISKKVRFGSYRIVALTPTIFLLNKKSFASIKI